MGILAFKGFESDLTCRGFQYEIGKTYKLPVDEAPVLCENGFHASLSLRDVFSFYPRASLFDKERSGNRYCVVELDGFRVSSFWAFDGLSIYPAQDKFCAAQITIKEELPSSDYELINKVHTTDLTDAKERYIKATGSKFFKKNEKNGLWYECSGREEGAVYSERFWDNVFDISSLLDLSFSREIPGLCYAGNP